MSIVVAKSCSCSSAEIQSTSTRCISERKTQPRRLSGRELIIASCEAVVERKSKKTGYRPAGRGSLTFGRCFSRETSHSIWAKGEVVATAVAAARAKVRPGWVLEDDAVAFSAIIQVLDILLYYVLILVKYRITIWEQGVRGNTFALAWRSNFGHRMEGERRMVVTEHFIENETLFPSYIY